MRLAIDRGIQRLADALIAKWSAGLVDGNHHLAARGALDDGEVGILLKLRDLVGRANLAEDVDITRPDRVVRRITVAEEAELDVRKLSLGAPVIVVAAEAKAGAAIPAGVLEWPGADRVRAVVGDRFARHDAGRASGHVEQPVVTIRAERHLDG